MTQNTTTDTEAADNLGSQLRQAREALNLSIDDVAKKINLRASVLQKIEHNNFVDPNIPPTFMRGYIRNYLKFLKLPESLLNDSAAVLGETPKNDLSKNTRATKRVNGYSLHNRWVSTITWLIVLIAIAMTVLWWWENHQQSNAERDNLVENYVSAGAVGESKLPNNPAPTTVTAPAAIDDNAQNALPATDKPAETALASVSDNGADNAVSGQNSASQSEPPQPAETAAQQDNAPATDAAQTESAVGFSQESQANDAAQAQDDAATDAELRIEVTGSSCWISVKDDNRREQAGKLYKQGETLSFNTGSPYSLIIGAPGNVKITYRGNEIPLKVDGKVKKFRLPQ